MLIQWQNDKQFPEPSEAPTALLWKGARQVRDKRHRLQTGGMLGKRGGEPGLDQAAHMAHSRGQRGLKEF